MNKLPYFLLIIICYLATLTNSFTIYNDGDVVEATTQVGPSLVEEKPEQDSSSDLETKTFTVTGYNTVIEQCDGDPCITASGENICGKTHTVACSKSFPFGTKFEINGEIYRCNDRFNKRYDDPSSKYFNPYKLDINFDKNIAGAESWGKRKLLVKILK